MRRRRWLITACLAAPLLAAAQPMGVEEAVVVEPEAPPQLLRHYRPAGSPLDRMASRPGAWYALLYLPMMPGWPVELVLRSAPHPHAVSLLGLDRAPQDAPSVEVALPLQPEGDRHGVEQTSHFMLPRASVAQGIFVLVEQWRSDAAPPAPLWVRARIRASAHEEPPPHWAATNEARGDVGEPRLTRAPPSPLTRELREGAPFELPIWGTPPSADRWKDQRR